MARVLGKDGGDRFDASCARPGDALRHALYRFNGVEPDRGRACALALNESLQSQYAYAPAANVLYEGPRVLVKSKCGTAKRYLQPEEARRKCELKAARRAARAAKLRRAAVDAAADAIASKTTRAAWVVVCTPPRCAPDQAEVAALTSRAAIPVVALTKLGARTVWKSTSAPGAPDNSSGSHFSAMTPPCWPRRAMRNRHCHAIEQARRWRGGRRDDSARTRRKILISTQAAHPRRLSLIHI